MAKSQRTESGPEFNLKVATIRHKAQSAAVFDVRRDARRTKATPAVKPVTDAPRPAFNEDGMAMRAIPSPVFGMCECEVRARLDAIANMLEQESEEVRELAKSAEINVDFIEDQQRQLDWYHKLGSADRGVNEASEELRRIFQATALAVDATTKRYPKPPRARAGR
ncbi:MAG TPA: hypothetical protein VGK67_17640 [Myxococcales bacterium]|jgi:hypothetical protein